MALQPLGDNDGSWQALKAAWRNDCEAYGEDFDLFAQGVFAVLDPLAAEGHPKAGIYGLSKSEGIDAICQVNRAMIPGYTGYVLRVRFITPSPRLDFGDFGVDDYAKLMVRMFFGIYELSQGVMRSDHIKFHLRSPSDRSFFTAVAPGLTKLDAFTEVKLQGSWLYVTKS